jgi:hypothetical protein
MTAQPENERIEFKYPNRETWLLAAIDAFRPTFDRILQDYDDAYGVPDDVRISVGFGYGAKQETPFIAGQTWARRATERDNAPTVFIGPMLDSPDEVLTVLVHELIHVALDCEDGHVGRFKSVAESIGLVPPLLQSHAGEFLAMEIADVVQLLGPYPHAALNVHASAPVIVGSDGNPITGPERPITVGPKPQVSRWFKRVCLNPVCPLCERFSGRFTRGVLALASPRCPGCNEPLSAE